MAKNNLQFRIEQLEKRMDKQDDVLFGDKGILTNHIPHIESAMLALETRMNVLSIINIGAIIVAIIVNKFIT